MRLFHAVILSALCGAVLTALLVLTGWLFEERAEQQARGRLVSSVALAQGALLGPVQNTPPARLTHQLHELSVKLDADLYVRLPDTTVVSSATPAPSVVGALARLPSPANDAGVQVAAPTWLPDPGGHLSAWTTLREEGSRRTVLWVTQSTDRWRASVLTSWGVLAAAEPLCLVLCALPALVLRHRTRYVSDRLSGVLRALAEGEFHVRAEPLHSGHHLDQLAVAVNELAASVQTVLEKQRTFLADVAHQLRNPMVALRLRVENLRPHLPEAALERQTRILSDVDRLHRTLADMLEHARSMPADHKTQVVDVCAVVEERVQGWAPVAEQRCVQLKVSMPRHAWGLSRSGAVGQALDVVLDNALRYSPAGSAIRIKVTTDQGLLLVQVHDEGPGLPDKDREAALQRGYSGSSSKGGGIGLSIARRLIESSGGRLELHPGTPQGLITRIHLLGAVPVQSQPGRTTTPTPNEPGSPTPIADSTREAQK
ncbi:sensor histidine kinase [Streptomyces broussonetiae]|uniref:sensor histidine kinase n=1 Tax=Streptomyces broussonetiae TaxID=2686304 RepID=UPI0035DFB800